MNEVLIPLHVRLLISTRIITIHEVIYLSVDAEIRSHRSAVVLGDDERHLVEGGRSKRAAAKDEKLQVSYKCFRYALFCLHIHIYNCNSDHLIEMNVGGRVCMLRSMAPRRSLLMHLERLVTQALLL